MLLTAVLILWFYWSHNLGLFDLLLVFFETLELDVWSTVVYNLLKIFAVAFLNGFTKESLRSFQVVHLYFSLEISFSDLPCSFIES